MAAAGSPPPLSCTVRACGQPILRTGAGYRCPRGHTFDVARSGYINLLQPQDRRSRNAGDSVAAVAARSRLLVAGVGAAAIHAITGIVGSLGLGLDARAVDLGCGAGELLGALAATGGAGTLHTIGIDLSTAAIDAAARRYPAQTWVVANADRRLPLLDASVDVVVSLNGRRNPTEAARVLRERGTLIVGVPAGDDLIELREQVLGGRVERERADLVVDDHTDLFTLRDRMTARERRPLDRAALLDLLEGTYRGRRARYADRRAVLDRLDVTSATELLVFVPTRCGRP